MKTIFIVNPAAGQGQGREKFIKKIQDASARTGIPVEIYSTAGVRDGEVLAAQIGEETKDSGEEVRLFACGGDGTLNEVVNGAIAYPHMSVGVIPIGTGNDFCRNFADAGNFMDFEAQLRGTAVKCDAIRYHGVLDGEEKTRYCVNMFNIGFDCHVADLTSTLKRYPLLSGSGAYLAAVLARFVQKKGASLKIELDGEVVHDGPLLLIALANGCYCGGGVKAIPNASVHNGLLEASLIYNVKRLRFLTAFPSYAKGTHLSLPDIDELLLAKQCRRAVITPKDSTMRLCTDGEIVDAGQVEMEIVQDAFSFIVPAVI